MFFKMNVYKNYIGSLDTLVVQCVHVMMGGKLTATYELFFIKALRFYGVMSRLRTAYAYDYKLRSIYVASSLDK